MNSRQPLPSTLLLSHSAVSSIFEDFFFFFFFNLIGLPAPAPESGDGVFSYQFLGEAYRPDPLLTSVGFY